MCQSMHITNNPELLLCYIFNTELMQSIAWSKLQGLSHVYPTNLWVWGPTLCLLSIVHRAMKKDQEVPQWPFIGALVNSPIKSNINESPYIQEFKQLKITCLIFHDPCVHHLYCVHDTEQSALVNYCAWLYIVWSCSGQDSKHSNFFCIGPFYYLRWLFTCANNIT